eukprot:TRINITY_DN955_c0_g1_i1.p1 TRINITY_DN955_c0_g1~~TRINITY_DN955_c0_g1_i1.p1  ORF type:complete len:162 (-),score=40.99 TRINITY_DN955_c0_g1_i1:165-650(-)
MKVFIDVISGDEMFSDSVPIEELDDIVYVVTGKSIVVGDEDYGIENNSGEALDSNKRTVINIVDAHKLQEAFFTKKDYLSYLKGYVQAVKKHLEATNPSRVDTFQKAAQDFVKNKLLPKFDNFQFFTGENQNTEGAVALVFYDGETPKLYYFKDGYRAEKV